VNRTRGKKLYRYSREELPDLLRQDRGRRQSASRFAQEHASRFSVPAASCQFRDAQLGETREFWKLIEEGERTPKDSACFPSHESDSPNQREPTSSTALTAALDFAVILRWHVCGHAG